jgi:hypothetical protein
VVVAVLALLASVAVAAPKKKGEKKPPAPEVVRPPEPTPAPPPAPAVKPAVVSTSGTPPEQRRMVGILDVRVDGVSDAVKVQFERGLEEQLDTKIFWLSSRAQMRERMKFSTKWTEGCLVGACLAELRTQTNAEIVLLAAFNGSGTSFGHVVTIVRTDTGRVLSQESGRCEVCTVNEAMAEATLSVLRLLNAVPDKLPDEAGDHSVAMDLVTATSKKQLAEARRSSRRRGIALTVIGLAVAGGGLATYVLKDKPDYALAITAAGGGLLLGGVVVLTF